jgi:transporter family protein
MSYQGWALLSALFAGLTAILGKRGVENVPVNLAVAARVVVVLLFAAAIAVATKQTRLRDLSPSSCLFLSLSGIGTGLSWLCYYRALQMGPVSQVAIIDKLSYAVAVFLGILVLREKPSANVIAGALVVGIGVYISLRK